MKGWTAEWRAGQITIRGVRSTDTHGYILPDPYLRIWVGWGIRLRPRVGLYRYTRFYKEHDFSQFLSYVGCFLFIPLKILKMVALGVGYKRLVTYFYSSLESCDHVLTVLTSL